MIQKLRKKFIAVSMCAVFLVLLTIISTINIMNYHNVNESADKLLTILAENNGIFPSTFEQPDSVPDFSPNPAPNNPSFHSPENKDAEFSDHHDISPEAPFNTRYFTVTITENSDASSILTISDTEKIAAVSKETAAEYAAELYAAGKKEGFIENYKYRQIETEEGIMYIFLDCERELSTFRSFLYASISISISGLFFLLILIIIFSKMAVAPIAESYEKQKRFITDASHEIKTPLAIIDANIEVIELENGKNKWTESIKNQIRRLSSLTEKLVFLSRMDEEHCKLNKTNFSLSAAVQEMTESFAAVAEAKKKTLYQEIPENISYCGDEAAIRQLISLLLDNAVKYSNEQGRISVSLRETGKSKELIIENTVNYIEPGRHDELFLRFYRPDTSRSKETGGFGIGLSVAKAITEAHKGKITAKSSDGTALTFTLLLS